MLHWGGACLACQNVTFYKVFKAISSHFESFLGKKFLVKNVEGTPILSHF